MTAPEREGTEDVDLDDLRRRLYRPDATDADLQHYLDERAAVVPTEPAVAPPPPRRPRRFLLVGVVAGVLVLAVATTGVLLHRPGPAPHRAAATAQPAARESALPSAAPGHANGPVATAVTIDGAATAAERFDGVGGAAVTVHLPGAEFGTQRAVVELYSSRTSTISWKALRAVAGAQQVVADDRITSHIDYAEPNVFTYAGAPPTRVAVEAPAGLHWTLLVAAAVDASSPLR